MLSSFSTWKRRSWCSAACLWVTVLLQLWQRNFVENPWTGRWTGLPEPQPDQTKIFHQLDEFQLAFRFIVSKLRFSKAFWLLSTELKLNLRTLWHWNIVRIEWERFCPAKDRVAQDFYWSRWRTRTNRKSQSYLQLGKLKTVLLQL